MNDVGIGSRTRPSLASLLTPRSIALVGASPKADSVGRGMIEGAFGGGYAGRVYLVNPNHAEIDGRVCYPAMATLPEAVDLAVIGVANARVEQQFEEAVRAGARAAVIFASCHLPDDRSPPLASRLAAMAQAAGMPICGGNGMGFYNLDVGLRACGFPPPDWLEPGGMTLISHSGSVFAALLHSDRRFRCNLAVSAGQELVTTAAEYLDFALDQESTRVVGLFLETVRAPSRFVAALHKAQLRDIPVVVLKVGRTPESAAMAVTHSGAMAGNHDAHEAVFDRYGVISVDTLDAFANALLLMAQPRRPAKGGLATIHDSGGEREALVDRAKVIGVPFAEISAGTKARLAARLDPGLDAVNPLDAWGTGQDFEAVFRDCLTALLDDPDTALGALFIELRSGYWMHEGYARAVQAVVAATDKPVLVASNFGFLGADDLAERLTRGGIPALNGADAALAAIRAAFAYRDFKARPAMRWPAPPAGARARWVKRLQSGRALDEADSLALLADYGVPAAPHRVAMDAAGAVAAAEAIGYPVVLKTATPGVHHKSDVGGVKLNLPDAAAVTAGHADLAQRLGPRVLVAAMAGKGVELAFGAVQDPQFGPLVMIGAGGVLIETMQDRRFALPPVDASGARRLIDRLSLRPLLDGNRGNPPVDVDALAAAFARFSVMAADLGDCLHEVDVNPVLAHPDGCIALDALVVLRGWRSAGSAE